MMLDELALVLDANPDNPARTWDLDRARDGVTPERRTVLVAVDRHTPLPAAPASWRTASCRLIVLTPHQLGDDAEDELDDALEQALDAVASSTQLPHWQSAERATYGEAWPCYEITLAANYKKESTA